MTNTMMNKKAYEILVADREFGYFAAAYIIKPELERRNGQFLLRNLKTWEAPLVV